MHIRESRIETDPADGTSNPIGTLAYDTPDGSVVVLTQVERRCDSHCHGIVANETSADRTLFV